MTGIMDTWQSLVLHWQYRVLAVIAVCTLGFVLGIPCTTQVPSHTVLSLSPSFIIIEQAATMIDPLNSPGGTSVHLHLMHGYLGSQDFSQLCPTDGQSDILCLIMFFSGLETPRIGPFLGDLGLHLIHDSFDPL